MKKKDRFKTNYDNKIYEIAGRWHSDIIFSPVEDQDDQCLIYTVKEIEEFLQTGELEKVDA